MRVGPVGVAAEARTAVGARRSLDAAVERSAAPVAVNGRSVLPWRDDRRPDVRFDARFLGRPVLDVARDLLGCRVVSVIDGKRTAGVIVETEAYDGPRDPASHAATVSGITRRNAVMFGPAGYAYVYRIYGMHWCMNVVTGRDGEAQAVLLRGLDPLEGEGVMTQRRGGRRPLAAGPGRLCQALGVTGELYAHDLTEAPLTLEPGWDVAREDVGVSGRIGVRAAADWPYRFYVRGAPGVSRHPATARTD